MTIKVGDKLPDSTFMTMGAEGTPKPMQTRDVFAGKKVALFAEPARLSHRREVCPRSAGRPCP